MERIVEKFCKEPTKKRYSKLPNYVQDLLVNLSFATLSQKTGDIKKSREILEAAGEIKIIKGYSMYTGKESYKDMDPSSSRCLNRIGVAIFPIISSRNLSHYQTLFDRTLTEFPEYKNPTISTSYSLGGFAALGNPSSFHNPFVRNLRLKCWEVIMPFFKDLTDEYLDPFLSNNYRLEVLWDRMLNRKKGQSPGAESWHRDVVNKKLILPTDEIYGGWINLDSEDQYFSCIPGSQLGISLYNIPSGFDTLQKRLKAEKNSSEEIKKITKKINSCKKLFKIPPGHMIIFPQYILHEVVSTKASARMRRLFLGWRLTVSKKSIYPNRNDIMKNQSVPPLPSGQIPPMYSSNHLACYLGVPTVKEIKNKNSFNFSKHFDSVAKKLFHLYPSKNMNKYWEKMKDKKINKRYIIAEMVSEYLKQPDINITFNKNLFNKNKNLTVNIGTMKITPENPASSTTLIKWSRDTFYQRLLIKKFYKNNRNNSYMIIPRHMESLRKLKLPLYSSYGKEERMIYRPYRLRRKKRR
jgi:hypothetical protein